MSAIVSASLKLPDVQENEDFNKFYMTHLNKVHEISEAISSDPPLVGPSQYFIILGKFI